MKICSMIAIVASFALGNLASAQEPKVISMAQASAVDWLALTDSGGYAASWEQAAVLFKTAVSKTNWVSTLQGVRAPLGAVKSRTLKAAQFAKSLPGVPDGEYVVIQFDTQFENKESALETVTPLKEKDGVWRVSGYYIK